MKTRSFPYLVLLLLLFALAACRGAAQPEPQADAAATAVTTPTQEHPAATDVPLSLPATEPDVESPAGVVEAFYTWYLDPEHEGDFRSSPYLSERIITTLDQELAGNPFLGADPFLLAQDTPGAIRVEPVSQGPDTARVVLHEIWNPGIDGESTFDLTLDLIGGESGWKIDQIQKGNPFTAQGTVQLFYNWYLAGNEGLSGPNFALRQDDNPLASRAYRDSPYLAPSLIAEVDRLLAAPPAFPYDPFLLARVHPRGVWQMSSELATAERTVVPLQVSYGHQATIIQVEVVPAGQFWQIVAIEGEVPDEATAAAQTVDVLYSRHATLWYDYASRHDLPHAGEELDLSGFWQANAPFYREDALLSPDFAAQVGRLPGDHSPVADPFYLAAGIPVDSDVGPAQVDGAAAEIAVTQRWIKDHRTRGLLVSLERVDGLWQVTGVREDPAADTPDVTEDALSPAEVLRAFFDDYLAGGGWQGGAAAASPYLEENYVQMWEQSDLSYYRELGVPVEEYDPILQGPALPEIAGEIRVEVGPVTVEEELHRAQARVDRVYPATGVHLPLYVSLLRGWDNQWRLADFQPVSLERDPLPAWQVGYLYSWALAYRHEPQNVGDLSELFRIPVADEAGIHFCSEEWPLGIAVDGAFLEPAGDEGQQRAWIVVRTNQPHHLFTIEMVGQAQQWQIVDHHCGDAAARRALAFYALHLGQPLSHLADREALAGEYLTADLALAVAEMQASLEGGSYDPFTQSEEQPVRFVTMAGPTDDSALVELTFADGSRQTLRLSFVLAEGRWLLSDIEGTQS